jgi:type III pantothenate kinase
MSDSYWFAVDVGNSRVKWGLFSLNQLTGDRIDVDSEPTSSTPLSEPFPWQQVQQTIPSELRSSVRCVIVGSNQAGVSRIVNQWPTDLAPPCIINSHEQFSLPIHVDYPNRVGLDRLLNAVAIHSLSANQTSSIVVDSGTATTVDLISENGAFEGGAILPGFDLNARALNEYTEALPRIVMSDLVEETSTCPTALGKNTEAAIASGIFWGQIGAVREVIAQLSEPFDQCNLVLTGGGSGLLAPHFPTATLIPHLGFIGAIAVAKR